MYKTPRYYILTIVLNILLYSGNAFSQSDTLLAKPQEIATPKVSNLLYEGQDIILKNPDKSLDLGLQALVLAKKKADLYGEASSLILLAEANFQLNQFENAIRYYNRALSLFENTSDYDILAKIYIGIAKVYDAAKNTELAIKTLEKGSGEYGKYSNINLYIKLVEYLGDLYIKQGNFKKAQQVFSQIIEITSRFDGSKIIFRDRIKANAFMKKGIALRNLGEIREGLGYFKIASETFIKASDSVKYSSALREVALSYYLIQKYDSAFQYQNLAYNTSMLTSDTSGVLESLKGLGNVSFEKGNLNEAINFYNQLLTLSENAHDINNTITALVKISTSYFALGDYPTANRFLNRALKSAKTNNLTESKADVYRYLALISEAQGRYKESLDFYKMWIEIRDSIYSDETGQKLEKLQILYEITQKEKENEILKQNAEIQKLQLAKTRYQTRILILVASIVSILLFTLIMLYRNNKKEIQKQRETEQRITEINKSLEKRMINEVKKQEKQQILLAQKSKLESLGTLAAGIAHEINQPLGGISMGLDNLLIRIQDHHCNEEYLKDKINTLFENVERIKKIIDHIRYFSRVQKPVSFTYVNINDIVKSSLFMVSAQYENHGVTINLDLDEGIGNITADKYKLEQVLLNLLSNAKFALEEKQKQANDNKYQKCIEIKTRKNDTHYVITFKDNGTGISQKNIDKIFDPFFTTKGEEKGTGLGLSISYGFIKDLLGDIKVESVEGEYTLFEISIPRE
ncbi:MAG: tetratricopeptide repeat protein [Bacteroidales bacterium]|nr:tetratricopeptide repeat protein [Bacteroidales bacterium]HPD96527.1 tetratricopeptide repeat protein [Tenuifilaceae bacterium]HRX31390.1 tetratricopeptide repeat protein [Tenuifilaceae bacterium]